MSEAGVDRVSRWLYTQQRVLANWHRAGLPGGVDELLAERSPGWTPFRP